MTFRIQDILIFSGALQGLFLVFTLRKMQDRNPATIGPLTLFLLVTAMTLTGRPFFMGEHGSMSPQLGLVLDAVIFVFGPLLYTYVKQPTAKHKIPMGSLFTTIYSPFCCHILIHSIESDIFGTAGHR